MNATSFFTSKNILALPTKANPKVYLSIDNAKVAISAFNLYNPFSLKARLLKKTLRFLCVHCNTLAKFLLPTVSAKKSNFIHFLEKELNTSLTTSVYIATEKDKLVVQLQDKNNTISYLKYPITEIGEKRLINESNAIIQLENTNKVPKLILQKKYLGVPFIIIENLDGSIGKVTSSQYRNALNSLKTKKSYRLNLHPRILSIRKKLDNKKQELLVSILDQTVILSKKQYLEVYEHGDFAPWNMIETKRGLLLFDFEYFEKEGLEYLDELKYNFQIAHLLDGKKGHSLINTISQKTTIDEFGILFKVFLIKEISAKLEEEKNYDFELSLLKLINIEQD